MRKSSLRARRSNRVVRLDYIATRKEQESWLTSPRSEGAIALREPPRLADDPYDDRLRILLEGPEWSSLRPFLRSYIEHSIFKPFETEPSEARRGWWNITIPEQSPYLAVNVWRQYVMYFEGFDFDLADGSVRANGFVFVDKEKVEAALGAGYQLPPCFAVGETWLKGHVRPQIAIEIDRARPHQLAELFNTDWMLSATRMLNLDLMQGGVLPGDRPRSHVPKLVDAIFAEPLTAEATDSETENNAGAE
jgi:hypothetical protein